MNAMNQTFTVVIHDEDGALWAEVEELPGCFATGDTLDGLWECLAESVSTYLSTPERQVRVQFGERPAIDLRESVETKALVDA